MKIIKVSHQKYIDFLNKKLKYDLMNYKFLKCNKLCTTEYLSYYLYNKKVRRKKNNNKKKLNQDSKKPVIFDNKWGNKAFTKYYNKHKDVHIITEKWRLLKKTQNLIEDVDYKLVGDAKRYLLEHKSYTKKYLLPYRRWNYNKRVMFWNKRKIIRLKFANFLNYFNNERCLINYNKEYVYNKTDYSVLHINLTPNNITLVVTKANGDIRFWGTSGTKKFKGSRKHTFLAIKSVARTMYYSILRKKIKNLKIVYRGRPNKIRLREVLRIFRQGSKWNKYDILAIIDMSPLPFNGCKKSKKRR